MNIASVLGGASVNGLAMRREARVTSFLDAWFGNVVVRISGPSVLIDYLKPYFRSGGRTAVQVPRVIVAQEEQDGLYRLATPAEDYQSLTLGGLIQAIRSELICEYDRVTNRMPLFGSAVGWNGKSVILLGTGAGKSALFAWLLNRGFSWVSDGALDLLDEKVVALLGPLRLRAEALAMEGRGPAIRKLVSTSIADGVELAPPEDYVGDETPEVKLIILPRYVPGSPATTRCLTHEDSSKLLNPDLGPEHEGMLQSIPENVPCLELVFGGLEQLEGTFNHALRYILDYRLDGADASRLLNGFNNVELCRAPANLYPVPAATIRALRSRLTIGMATYDDYDGVYFSIQALRLYHPEVMKDVEILVLDNHPSGACAAPLKDLEKSIENFRYVPNTEVSGTAVRDKLFSEAQGEFVLCMDCHVLFVPGSVKRLLDYMDANPDTVDLLQGPLVKDNLTSLATHFDPQWRGGMYGTWGMDERGRETDSEPFDIPMQGLGVFACRTAAWPGFNSQFRGFGGEEGYIHEKFRQRGGRALCLPFLRWLHRFQRPFGVPYRNKWEDRVRNYLIGYAELGQSATALRAHMNEIVGTAEVDRMFVDFETEFGSIPSERAS